MDLVAAETGIPAVTLPGPPSLPSPAPYARTTGTEQGEGTQASGRQARGCWARGPHGSHLENRWVIEALAG